MRKTLRLFAVGALVLLASCQQKEVPMNLNVMSFNIRYAAFSDTLNPWDARRNGVAQVINDNNIDIVGTQEVLHNQLVDMNERLNDYAYVGVGREDGKEAGEHSAIFYRKDRFALKDSGTFWLSETPEVAGSKGWDGACERVGTWAILEDVKTKKQVFAINTHLDHEGQVARIEGVKLLTKCATELSKGLPIVMTGDFNAAPESDVVKTIIDKDINPNHLVHARDIAEKVEGTSWSFHDFDRIPEEKRELIDFIFVDKNAIVRKYEVLPMKVRDILISDHSPVVAHITLK